MYLAAALFLLALNAIFFFKQFPFFQIKATFNKSLVKEIFQFSGPLLIQDFFGVLFAFADNLMLVYFRPLTEVAIYNVILPTADLLLMLGRPFGRILFPMASELLALGKKDYLCFLLQKIHKNLFLILLPTYILLFTFAGDILKILFGAQYQSGALGLQILVLAFVLNSLNISSNAVLMGAGKSGTIMRITVTTNVLNVLLNLILIPFFGQYNQGYLGAVISTTFCSLLSTGMYNYALHKYIGYKSPLKEIFISIFLRHICLKYIS